MLNLFNNLFNEINLSWYNLIFLSIFISFAFIGFKKGLIRELISLVFLIISIFIAWLFYKEITNIALALFNIEPIKNFYSTTFLIILLLLFITKIKIYKIIIKVSCIDNPCELNNYIAKTITCSLIILISWSYVSYLNNLAIMSELINNEIIRYWLSFIVIFITISYLVKLIIKLLNITINTEQSCLLEDFFSKFIYLLRRFNGVINTTNNISLKNKLSGIFIGFIKGFIFVLIIIVIIQNIQWINQKDFWIEAQGILKIFQDLSVKISPIISEQSILIETNQIDEIIIER